MITVVSSSENDVRLALDLYMTFSFSDYSLQGFRVKEGLSCVPRRGNVPGNVHALLERWVNMNRNRFKTDEQLLSGVLL